MQSLGLHLFPGWGDSAQHPKVFQPISGYRQAFYAGPDASMSTLLGSQRVVPEAIESSTQGFSDPRSPV